VILPDADPGAREGRGASISTGVIGAEDSVVAFGAAAGLGVEIFIRPIYFSLALCGERPWVAPERSKNDVARSK